MCHGRLSIKACSPLGLALSAGSQIIASMLKDSFVVRRCAGRHATIVEAYSARSFARHSHDEYGIGVMLAGAQRSWSGRGFVEAGVGDLIMANPGEVHDGAPIGGSRRWAMMYMSPAAMAAIAVDISEGRLADMEFVAPVVRRHAAGRRFAAAYAALVGCDEDVADEQMTLLVAELLGETERSRAASSPSIERARSRIDTDPAARHSLDDLATLSGIGRFQTLRSFARLTGLTPHAYIVQRRLDLARSMIRNGAALADTAIATGFADQSHFHRSFVRRYGVTPGAYAAAMR